MSSTLTVRLSASEAQGLDILCASHGKSRSELVREALRQSQMQLAPPAPAAGWLTEDDVLQHTVLS